MLMLAGHSIREKLASPDIKVGRNYGSQDGVGEEVDELQFLRRKDTASRWARRPSGIRRLDEQVPVRLFSSSPS